MKNLHPKVNVLLRFSGVKIVVTFTLNFALYLLVGCSTSPTDTNSHQLTTPDQLISKNKNEISVMSFNVENLFDAQHDPQREDYTFLPLSQKNTPEVQKYCLSQSSKWRQAECLETDWNENVVKTKLKQIAKVLRHIDNGQGPDNLMLIEVENISILNRLVKEELNELGYQTVVLLEGPDTRGIDPGFISKFPLVGSPKLHIIPYHDDDPEQLKWAQKSRGLLEVTVKTPSNTELTFLIGHFPSQNNPVSWRKQAVQYATHLISEYEKNGRAVIFGGDLNISKEEEKNEKFFSQDFSRIGQVSHLVGCQSCLGTHNFKGSWSFLDALIYSNTLNKSGYQLIPESIQVVKTAHHTKANGAPKSFRLENLEGVSDHFPLYSRLKSLK